MSKPIRFGFGFDLRNPVQWQRPTPDLYAETLDFIAATGEMGFLSVWLAEHHGIEDGYNPSVWLKIWRFLITFPTVASNTPRALVICNGKNMIL